VMTPRSMVRWAILTVSGIALVGIAYIVCFAVGWDRPVKVADITSGAYGGLTVGQSKKELLMMAVGWTFTSYETVTGCRGVWATVPVAATKESHCLYSSDHWLASSSIEQARCPSRTDAHVTLHFAAGSLARINIRCSRAE